MEGITLLTPSIVTRSFYFILSRLVLGAVIECCQKQIHKFDLTGAEDDERTGNQTNRTGAGHQQKSRRRHLLQHSVDKLQAKFQAQSVKMQKLKRDNEMLRRRNKQLVGDLETSHQKLRKIDHLKCEICLESFKNKITRCGHGFCSDCLTTWLRSTDGDDFRIHGVAIIEPITSSCPMCRTTINEKDDVWPLYLGADSNGQDIDGEDSGNE